MTTLRQAAQTVLKRWDSPAWKWHDQGPTANVIDALREALAEPEQEPVAWAVQGCSKMWRGEFAEIDAKAEAKRIGGTCVAYALYTIPPAAKWDKPSASFNEWWDSDHIDPANPFAEDSAAYWAWAGWKAAQRPWVGLTDEEIQECLQGLPTQTVDVYARRIEAKLKERNT